MLVINPADVKRVKEARKIIQDLQQRLYNAENCLDDLSRSVEIAQYTKQFNVVEVFVKDAEELLKDRLVLPEIKQDDVKYTIIEGTLDQSQADKLNEEITKLAVKAAGIESEKC